MPISYFDKMSHSFKCPNAQCSKVFEQTYRSLLQADTVVCPACGTSIDIRGSKLTGDIGSWFTTIAWLDKKDNQKG
jgi:transcription elongation factor Elf1